MADIAKGTSPYVPDACMPSDAAVPGYMVRFAFTWSLYDHSSHTKGTGVSWIAQGHRRCVSRQEGGPTQRPADNSRKR